MASPLTRIGSVVRRRNKSAGPRSTFEAYEERLLPALRHGLTVRRLAECGAAGAQHAAGSVRAAAERILLAAYARSPRVVRAQLPPDDAVTRRNLIYRHLFQQFDRIDMQKMLNQAPTEEQLLNGNDQSMADSTLETASVTQSTRSGTTVQVHIHMKPTPETIIRGSKSCSVR